MEQTTRDVVAVEITNCELIDLVNDNVLLQKLREMSQVTPDVFADQHCYKRHIVKAMDNVKQNSHCLNANRTHEYECSSNFHYHNFEGFIDLKLAVQ